MRNYGQNIWKVGLPVILILFIFIGYNRIEITVMSNIEDSNKEQNIDSDFNENVDNQLEEDNKTINILSMGNIIIHQAQLDGAKTQDGYDFSPSFTFVKDIISVADISMGVLETTLSGGVPTGYPWFNSPDELIGNMRDAGIDIINYANNHINDGLEQGIDRTIELTREQGIDTLGIRKDLSEKRYLIKEVKGEKIGFISYVYETNRKNGQKTINSNILQGQSSENVNTFNYNELEKFYEDIENEIRLMKEDGAKFIITSMHWGEEYETIPSDYQIVIANQLNALGVDVILGGHPHVIQPYERIVNESGHETFVLYSQGNTLSNQAEDTMGIAESEDGILANITLELNEDKLLIKNVDIIPIWDYREEKSDGIFIHRIIDIQDALSNPVKYNFSENEINKLNISLGRTEKIIGTKFLESN